MYGKRELKYNVLADNTLKTLPWKIFVPNEPNYLFIPQDIHKLDAYKKKLFGLTEIFGGGSNGVQTKRDALFIDFEPEKLEDRIKYLLSPVMEKSFISEFQIEDSSSYPLLRKIENSVYDGKNICSVLYRRLDMRSIYYDVNLLGRPFYKTLKHMHLKKDNYCLVLGRQGQAVGGDSWNLVTISASILDNNLFYRGGNMAYPLYLYPDTSQQTLEVAVARKPNLDPAIIAQFATHIGLTFTAEKEDSAQTFAPIDLLDYIYAILHSPTYRETYKEFLKIDFPRVPYPADAAQFWQLVALGGQLRQAHLLESDVVTVAKNFVTSYPIAGTHSVDKPTFALNPDSTSGKVWINTEQYFEGVPQIAWDFYIGGYQPAQKWLKDRKDRKGRQLNFDDIVHYQRIIAALTETHRLMGCVDGVFSVDAKNATTEKEEL